jgi:hypothetical protein
MRAKDAELKVSSFTLAAGTEVEGTTTHAGDDAPGQPYATGNLAIGSRWQNTAGNKYFYLTAKAMYVNRALSDDDYAAAKAAIADKAGISM